MSDPVLSPLQRIAAAFVAFAISWTLIASVCVVMYGMSDGSAAAYAAASAIGGILLHEWWLRRTLPEPPS